MTNLTFLKCDSTIVFGGNLNSTEKELDLEPVINRKRRPPVQILNYWFEEIESSNKNFSTKDSNKLQEEYERVPNSKNEETIEGMLSNLELRYKNNKEIDSIYDKILVSINPFFKTNLYSNDYIRIHNGYIKDPTSESKEPNLFKTSAKI